MFSALLIDPGTRHTGLAHVVIEKSGMTIIDVCQVTNPLAGKCKGYPMYKGMIEALRPKLLTDYTVDAVYIEEPASSTFPNQGMFFLAGALYAICKWSVCEDTQTINPRIWTRGVKKPDRKELLQDVYGAWGTWPGAERFDTRDEFGVGNTDFKKEKGCGVYPDFLDAVGIGHYLCIEHKTKGKKHV